MKEKLYGLQFDNADGGSCFYLEQFQKQFYLNLQVSHFGHDLEVSIPIYKDVVEWLQWHCVRMAGIVQRNGFDDEHLETIPFESRTAGGDNPCELEYTSGDLTIKLEILNVAEGEQGQLCIHITDHKTGLTGYFDTNWYGCKAFLSMAQFFKACHQGYEWPLHDKKTPGADMSDWSVETKNSWCQEALANLKRIREVEAEEERKRAIRLENRG